jgi:drug/metabolite transporter (DMT)-like permease
VANAVFLFAASPIFTAILGWLILGERVRRATWISIALAAIGMFIMVREGLAAGEAAGNIAAVLSALGFASFTITLRWGRTEDTTPSIVLGGLFSMLIAVLMLPLQGETLAAPLSDIVIALVLGACLLGTGLVLYTIGARVVPAAELTLLSMVEVLLAPIWVWLVLGESASAATFLGGAILLAAIAGNALTGLKRKPLAPPIT